MEQAIRNRINEWLTDGYDQATRREIQNLVDAKNEKELIDRFYMELEFGTAGLRGTLGAGSNRMNVYNVRKASQGLANYIIQQNGQKKGVLIGRDSRLMSDVFAQDAASVFAANGIKVYFYEEIHPTPTVSFGTQFLGAMAGVMITASHNPKEYNGYKVVWEDGAQITPPHDDNIIEEVRKVDSLSKVKYLPFSEVEKSNLFEIVDRKVDGPYLERVLKLSIHPEAVASSDIKVCYTPLYGTGFKLIPQSLKNYGFKNILIVEEQAVPNGNFPTAPFPNPEEPEAMKVGMEFAKAKAADVLIASDPDADRIGIVLKKDDGGIVLLNGNQIATLFTYYMASELKASGRMPKNPAMISTIVTTPLLLDIAKSFGIHIEETLTGFKWIGMKAIEYGKAGLDFVFGCEESHGYLAGDFVKDKDAVIAASLFAELTAFYRSKGTSAYTVLMDIYRKYGYYKESQKSVTMKGADGAAEIKALMEKLRKSPPKSVGKYEVLSRTDLRNGEIYDMKSEKTSGKIDLPSSNVIIFRLSDGARIIGRPSGTEPKIKFYFSSLGNVNGAETVEGMMDRLTTEHTAMKSAFLKELGLE